MQRAAVAGSGALPQCIRRILGEGRTGESLLVHGWVRSLRRQKNVAFLDLNDGSTATNLQVALDPADARGVVAGTSLAVHGRLVGSRGAEQAVELQAEKVTVLGHCCESYPMQKKEHGTEFLRSQSHLKCRTSLHSSVARIRSAAAHELRGYLLGSGFLEVHAPVITFSDCEGAGEAFSLAGGLEFFGSPAHLTVSSQLHAEIAAASLGKVYTFGPIFRAEQHNTTRHLAEFWMLEPEVAFVDDLSVLIGLAEDMLRVSTRRVLEGLPADWQVCVSQARDQAQVVERLSALTDRPLVRMTYAEAVGVLVRSGAPFAYPVRWGVPLQTEHERFLCEQHVRAPLCITDYPRAVKAFYMRDNGASVDPGGPTVACFDLLLPGVGEVIGGSLREERLPVLEGKMAEFGLDTRAYQWYLDLRRYGSVPHGGFGLGFERYLQFLTGLANIRDACLVPRVKGASAY